ncbi:pro-FMRFamide-related neuropeptide VF [Elgaria multicarinata webbii]|uniref:pro-FMRFamide-related neuropeptide VF n=1 Tax=Elgaria multicarinata webbii TaxID=159646 RepID=UPI002FCD1D5D
MNRLILFSLATCFLLARETICFDESLITNLQSREEYSDDNYSESSEDIIEEKQRSVNLEELKDWELQNIIKMSTPTIKKVPDSVANLPLRFGRNFQEERSIKPAANLPLRFGRASAGSHSRHPIPVSHRFERAPFVQSSFHNLPQRFGRARPFNLPQETQDYDQDKKKFGSLYNHMKRDSDDEGDGIWKTLDQFPL